MKISAKGRYGLAAMTYLARNFASGSPITIISISEKLGISKIYLEQVFSLPGLGRMLLTSIANRDYPVVQAVVVIVAFWVVLVNLLADLINQRLDPRLRLT